MELVHTLPVWGRVREAQGRPCVGRVVEDRGERLEGAALPMQPGVAAAVGAVVVVVDHKSLSDI